MRQPRAPVDERAVRIALRVLDRRGEDFTYYLTGRDRQAYKAGELPTIKQDSKAAEGIIHKILPAIECGRNAIRVRRLRDGLAEAFGKRAFDAVVRRLAWEAAAREQRAAPAAGRDRGVYLDHRTVTVTAVNSSGKEVMTIVVDVNGGDVPYAVATGYEYLDQTDPVKPDDKPRTSREGPIVLIP